MAHAFSTCNLRYKCSHFRPQGTQGFSVHIAPVEDPQIAKSEFLAHSWVIKVFVVCSLFIVSIHLLKFLCLFLALRLLYHVS